MCANVARPLQHKATFIDYKQYATFSFEVYHAE